MPALNFDLELPNLNAQRRFPFDIQATCRDVTGSFEIPTDFLCDLAIAVPSSLELGADALYLRSLTSSSNGWTLLFGYGDPVTLVAACSIPASSASAYSQFPISGLSPYEDIHGHLSVWSTDSILSQPAGEWTFEFEDGALDPYTVRPQLRGIQRLRVVTKGQRSAPIVGNVELVPRNYQLITVGIIPDQPTQITFAGSASAGLTEDCACGDSSDLPCVRSVGGAVPDEERRIFIEASDCLQVDSDGNIISILDECCTPCGPCDPLEEVTRAEELARDRRLATEALYASMAATLAALQAAFSASRIGLGTCDSADEDSES